MVRLATLKWLIRHRITFQLGRRFLCSLACSFCFTLPEWKLKKTACSLAHVCSVRQNDVVFFAKVMQLTWLASGTWVTTSGSTHQHIVDLIHSVVIPMQQKTTTLTKYWIYACIRLQRQQGASERPGWKVCYICQCKGKSVDVVVSHTFELGLQ